MRSLANCEADGGTIESPGGGLRFKEPGLDGPNRLESEGAIAPSDASSLPGLFSRASIIDLCWSRTLRLLCSCSLIIGSCVWNPGDKQASPTSFIFTPSRAVIGPLGPRTDSLSEETDNSNLRGRGFDCTVGDAGGSFFTVTFDAALAPCVAGDTRRLSGGELFAADISCEVVDIR